MVQHLRTNVLQRKLFAEVICDAWHPPVESRGYVQVIRRHGSTRGHTFLISFERCPASSTRSAAAILPGLASILSQSGRALMALALALVGCNQPIE